MPWPFCLGEIMLKQVSSPQLLWEFLLCHYVPLAFPGTDYLQEPDIPQTISMKNFSEKSPDSAALPCSTFLKLMSMFLQLDHILLMCLWQLHYLWPLLLQEPFHRQVLNTRIVSAGHSCYLTFAIDLWWPAHTETAWHVVQALSSHCSP